MILYPNNPEPLRVEIETTNICNANCIFCPRSNIKEYGKMDFEKYKEFILSLKEIKKNLWLTNNLPDLNSPLIVFGGYGESLINKDIFNYILFAKTHGFTTQLISNGYLLNMENCENLIKSGLDMLAISLHTLDKDINKKVTKLPDVIPVIKKALKYFDDKEIIIEIRRVCNLDGSLLDPAEHKDSYTKFISAFNKDIKIFGPTPAWNRGGQFNSSFYKKTKDSSNIPCHTSYFTLNVSYDGDFILCACDFSAKTTILAKKRNFDFKYIQNKIADYQFNLPNICINCRKPINNYYDQIYLDNCKGKQTSLG